MVTLGRNAAEKPKISAPSPLEARLRFLAKSDPAEFSNLFKRTRESHMAEVTRACVCHLAEHGIDEPGRKMQIWLLANSIYFDLLLDPNFLSESEAFRVASIMRDASCQFSLNLQRSITGCKSPLDSKRLDRAIRLIDKFGDPGLLIPWLRGLEQHSDHLVRSKAARSLCSIRPTLPMIERQLKSSDARVRANAVEALWSRTGSEVIELLRSVLNDESHRVVINALIGLHYLRVSSAFDKLLTLRQHPSEAMRIAAIWGLGFLGDSRAIPELRELTQDPSPTVSAKALSALRKLVQDSDQESRVEGPEHVTEEVASSARCPLGESEISPTEARPNATVQQKLPEEDVVRKHRSIDILDI